MSYTTGTTHYNLPQTVGSDKRDWTDTNEAFSDVDAALWEAHQGATQAALDIASINSEIQTITGKQADDEADIATISGKVSTLETTVANHTTEIGDVRRDLQDNIESLREDTATSTHAYEIGDYFYYNDVLFKATAQIAIGATIVPNTNCTGVTVMDELKNGGAGSVAAADVAFDNTASGLTATDVQDALDEINAKIPEGSGEKIEVLNNSYTAKQMLEALFAQIDMSKVTVNAKLEFTPNKFATLAEKSATELIFTLCEALATELDVSTFVVNASSSVVRDSVTSASTTAFHDYSSSSYSETKITLYY